VGRTVARAAKEVGADLILMASRGRTAAGALMLESAAEQVLGEARVPLLVVKHFGARRGFLPVLLEKVRRRDELRFS
jgi:nucleotide-binding universal stress UspA family protein